MATDRWLLPFLGSYSNMQKWLHLPLAHFGQGQAVTENNYSNYVIDNHHCLLSVVSQLLWGEWTNCSKCQKIKQWCPFSPLIFFIKDSFRSRRTFWRLWANAETWAIKKHHISWSLRQRRHLSLTFVGWFSCKAFKRMVRSIKFYSASRCKGAEFIFYFI